MTATFRRSSTIRALLLALLAMTAAACDGSSSPPPSEDPLATLGGELRAAATGAAPGPLRLALAWYPGLMSEDGQPMSRPGAIDTQDVAYTGALPQSWTFDVREAPPATALVPMPQGYAGQGAIGIVLAYEDGNGNGALDTIPADGAPIDRVVGASLEWTASPAFLVVYLTDDQPAVTGLKAGFNLLAITGAETTEVVALSTPIPLSISDGDARLDLFVCEAAWDGSSTQAPCGLELDDGEPVLEAELSGEIYASGDHAEAAFGLVELVGGQPADIDDATVTLDGVEIPWDLERGFHLTTALDPAMFAEARTVELVATRGEAVLRRSIAIPAFDFAGLPATVQSGTAFDVAWSVPDSAESFDLFLFGGDAFLVDVYGLDQSPYHVTPVDYVGEATLSVAAVSGGEVTVTVVRSTTLTFEAAEPAPTPYPYPVPIPFPPPIR
jgi:hypothetical protein